MATDRDSKKPIWLKSDPRSAPLSSSFFFLSLHRFCNHLFTIFIAPPEKFSLIRSRHQFWWRISEGLSRCKFWIYLVDVNTRFTAWQRKFCVYTHQVFSKFTTWQTFARRFDLGFYCLTLRTVDARTCCLAFGSGAVTTWFNDLITSAAAAGFEARPSACNANVSSHCRGRSVFGITWKAVVFLLWDAFTSVNLG